MAKLPPEPTKPPKMIRLTGVRQNNLKNINAQFPSRQLTVVTGLSGSGKSSLAFDTLYAEGQRRYIESLSTYTRQFLEKMPKPDLDRVENIPPAIALEQRNHVVNSRSTVGTQTEIIDYLRLLFSKVGETFCIQCGTKVKRLTSEDMTGISLDWFRGRKGGILAQIDLGGSAKTKKKRPSVASYLEVLREQGFSRFLLKVEGKTKSKPEMISINLDDGETDVAAELKAAKNAEALFVVIDRIKFSKTESPDSQEGIDTRARISDSLAQALSVGQDRALLFDYDTSEFQELDRRYACPSCGLEHKEPEPNLFSFNSPIGACGTCSGFGFTLDLDESLIVPDPSKTLKNGAIDPFSKPSGEDWQTAMFRFAERHGISVGKRYRELTPAQKRLLWEGDPKDKTFSGIIGCFEELKRYKYKIHVRVFIRRYQSQTLCGTCKGSRLKPDALAVKVGGRNLPEVLDLPISESNAWLHGLKLSPNDLKIAAEIFEQVKRRLHFLDEVGLDYLTLSRLAKSLSGGEFQRINLATQLGNGLCGTLYILDEPSIGLHAADTERLIRVLKRLRDQGNTVVVVEHDLQVMKSADWIIELGPGAGRRGGELVAEGTAATVEASPGSVTGKYLSGAFKLKRSRSERPAPKRWIEIRGASENNLAHIDAKIPLDRLVVVTGVSGSGKSTLVHKTLFRALDRLLNGSNEPAGKFDKLYGAEQVRGIVLLDQSPIGRSSRSNPATYLKAWDEIRRIYANQVLALKRGYTPQYFSFNVDGGRCAVCKGEGEITLDMHFMAEVKLPCEECDGKRFKKAVLEVTYKGKNVDQLLNSTIDEAFEIFRDNATLARKFGILREVGLGYLQVGQSGTTLSGGESQRLKIAHSLDDVDAEQLLYIFDEPTTGLHLDDVKRLMNVIQDLVDAKHSVVMIEHHLDVVAQADWVIDLGPGGGKNGGQIVAAGPPAKIMGIEESHTGRMLKAEGYSADDLIASDLERKYAASLPPLGSSDS